MENFLLNFENQDTNVKSSNAKISVSPEFYGSIDISKGALSMNKDFYAKVYSSKYENCVALDDWDINETTNIKFGGAPIDSLSMLQKSMIDSGLGTLASMLDINNKDVANVICISIQQTKLFRDIFGKNAMFMDLMSAEEKNKVYLSYLIKNYDKEKFVRHESELFATEDEEGNKVYKSYGELIEMYNELNK